MIFVKISAVKDSFSCRCKWISACNVHISWPI